MARRALLLLVLLPVACLGYCVMQIPGGADREAASLVGRHIAAGYGKFDNRQTVERTGRGKIYYSDPGARQHPTIILYEVTSNDDVARVEALARQVLDDNRNIRAISLHFYEKQNLTFSTSGAASRGWERAFKKVTVRREDGT